MKQSSDYENFYILFNKLPCEPFLISTKLMTTMKKIFPVLFGFSLLLAACSKDNSPGGGTTTPNYQPVTAGSTWTYESTNKLTSAKSSYTLTATSGDSAINGKTYKIFTNSGGSNDYYYNNGTEYYQFGGIAGITGNTELLYLKSNVAVASGWNETKTVTIPGLGTANVKLGYTLVEKMANLTVEGVTYNDVMHVKVDLSDISVSGIPVTISSQDLHFYYAPNVGRVKSVIKLTLTPPIGSPIVTESETNLKSYTIK